MKKKNVGLYITVGLTVALAVGLVSYKFGGGVEQANEAKTEQTTNSSKKEIIPTATFPEVVDSKGNNIDGEDSKYYEHLNELTSTELLKNMTDKKEMILYIGRPTCPECRVFLPIQMEVLKKANRDIYYLNTNAEKADNKRLTDMKTFLEKTGINEVPTIVKITYKDDNVNFEQAPVEIYTELSGKGYSEFLK